MADVDIPIALLSKALDRASFDIKQRVRADAERAANTMANYLRSNYPQKTGVLRRGVSVRTVEDGYMVRSSAPYVHFIERGTVDRFDPTRRNAFRGRVKPNPIFIPAAIRERRSYFQRAESLLAQNKELV